MNSMSAASTRAGSGLRVIPPALLAFGGMCALAAAVGIGRFVYTPILPSMLEQLHLSKAQAGFIASSNFIGYLVGALAAAIPGLPGSRVRWLMASAILVAISMLAMTWADDMPAFLLLRFVAGVASAFVLIFASNLVLGGLVAMRALPFAAIHFAGVGFGIGVSAALIAALHAAHMDWRTQWLAAGLVALALLPATVFVRDHETASIAATTFAERLPGLPSFALTYGLCGFGYSITATFLVAMVRATPASGSLETLTWLCVGIAAIPSVWFWGIVGRRLGERRAMAAASVLLAFGNAAAVLAPNAFGLITGAVLLGATFMGITALGFAATHHLSPERRRSVAALITAAFGLGQIVGPALAGALADRTGSFLAPTLLAAAGLLAGAVLLITRQPANERLRTE